MNEHKGNPAAVAMEEDRQREEWAQFSKTIMGVLGVSMDAAIDLAREIDSDYGFSSVERRLRMFYNANGREITDEELSTGVLSWFTVEAIAMSRADLLTRLGLEVDRRRGQSIARLRQEVAL